MMKRFSKKGFVVILVLCVAGCGMHKVTSIWREIQVTVDGDDTEWRDRSPQYYEEDQRLVIRVANDDDGVLLCLSTGSSILRRQLESGMSVWLDPAGGKNKVFGVQVACNPFSHHDVGFRPGGMGKPGGAPCMPRNQAERMDKRKMSPKDKDDAMLEITFSEGADSLILKKKKARDLGIEVATGQTGHGHFVYESRIAFKSSDSLSGLKPGMTLGIGFIGQKSSLVIPMGPPSGKGMGFSSGSMGTHGGGGGMPGGGGGRGPGMRTGGQPDPLKVWLKVRLAGQAVLN